MRVVRKVWARWLIPLVLAAQGVALLPVPRAALAAPVPTMAAAVPAARPHAPGSDPVGVVLSVEPASDQTESSDGGDPHIHSGSAVALPAGPEIDVAAATQRARAGWDSTGSGFGSAPTLTIGITGSATIGASGGGGRRTPLPTAPHIGPTCSWTDPGTWMPCFMAGLLNIVALWVGDAVDTVSVANVWSHTDSQLTDANPTVVRYYSAARVLADACLGGIALGILIEIYLSFKAGRLFAAALERFWRVSLVAMVANGALPVIGDALYLANLATQAMDVAQQTHLIAIATQSPVGAGEASWMLAGLFIINGIMSILLFIQMLMRIGLLDVLIILAPLGLMCYAWARLQFWAELWGRLFVATLITQFIQVAALHMGEDLVTDAPSTFITSLNPTTLPLSEVKILVQDLVAIAVFVVVLRVPRMLRGHGHGPGLGGIILAVKAARTVGIL